jgi:branched-subunit amino acid transport protein
MTSPIGEGWAAIAAILIACALPTQVWRWFGVAIGRGIDPDSDLLLWVRSVATAIIAAFVANVVFFPAGALADTPLWLRLVAMGCGIAAYLAARRIVVVGVGAAVGALVIGRVLLG